MRGEVCRVAAPGKRYGSHTCCHSLPKHADRMPHKHHWDHKILDMHCIRISSLIHVFAPLLLCWAHSMIRRENPRKVLWKADAHGVREAAPEDGVGHETGKECDIPMTLSFMSTRMHSSFCMKSIWESPSPLHGCPPFPTHKAKEIAWDDVSNE